MNKRSDPQPVTPNAAGNPADPLSPAARAEATAAHVTALALTRWRSGISYMQMQVDAALGPSCQARWYAQANANLHCWLQNGGFGQPDEDAAAAPPDVPAPPAPRNPAPRKDEPSTATGVPS